MEITASLPRISRHRLASPPRCRKSSPSRCRRIKNHQRSYNRNQQYSTSAITDGSGTVVERYVYSAYGTPTITDANGTTRTATAVGNRYTYTGREWDDTLALYHYRARMYDSAGGRFVSRDPIGFEGSPWNQHEYGGANPCSVVDPSGMTQDKCDGLIAKRRFDCAVVVEDCNAAVEELLTQCEAKAAGNPSKLDECWQTRTRHLKLCVKMVDRCKDLAPSERPKLMAREKDCYTACDQIFPNDGSPGNVLQNRQCRNNCFFYATGGCEALEDHCGDLKGRAVDACELVHTALCYGKGSVRE